jgi:hypothetical protein
LITDSVPVAPQEGASEDEIKKAYKKLAVKWCVWLGNEGAMEAKPTGMLGPWTPHLLA